MLIYADLPLLKSYQRISYIVESEERAKNGDEHYQAIENAGFYFLLLQLKNKF